MMTFALASQFRAGQTRLELCSQPWILRAEQSGSQTHIAATGSVSLFMQRKS